MSTILTPVTTAIDFEKTGKQSDYFRIPHSRNSSAWGRVMIPITVISHGQGPTVLFIAGSHGGEHEGVVTLLKLCRDLQAEQVNGRVIIIPALNLPAVLTGQRLSPIDDKDMNRIFPGMWNGSISQIIAHYVHEVLLPMCDAVIDLHSGGASLSLLPYMSMHYLDDAAYNERTFAAMQAFNAPISLVIEEISGEGLLDYAVERMGKPFLCAELGSAGTLSPQAQKIGETGVWNLLKHFEIIEGELEERDPPPQLMQVPDPSYYHTAMANGIYESFFGLGDWIEEDTPIGQIHFVENHVWYPKKIMAQRSGMLLCRRAPGHVELGDCVAVVAQELPH